MSGRGRFGAALSTLLAVLAGISPILAAEFPKWIDTPLVWAQIPAGTVDATVTTLMGDLPTGSRIVMFNRGEAKTVRVLTPGFLAAGRPDLSFDGRRLLFIGKREATESFNVWEMDLDGTEARRITDQATDCTDAVYLSTLYTIDAAEPEYRIGFANRGVDGVVSIYTCRLDGSDVKRITYHPYGASSPYLLSDGRLLFSAHEPDAERPASNLLTVNTDGTDLGIFTVPADAPVLRTMPCEIPGGPVVFVEAPSSPAIGPSRLVAVSRSRSTRTREVIAADEKGSFLSPSPFPDGRLLVSHLPAASATSAIRLIDPRGTKRSREVYDDPEWHDVEPLAVHARPEPAGRSSSLDPNVDFGFVYCLEAYVSNTRRGRDIARGQIEWLRVLEHTGATGGGELGTVRVEKDGSFYLKIHARTPVRLETLDATGVALQGMDRWFWVMPRETRGCIGCHEDPELAPANRHVLALRRQPVPVGFPAESDEADR